MQNLFLIQSIILNSFKKRKHKAYFLFRQAKIYCFTTAGQQIAQIRCWIWEISASNLSYHSNNKDLNYKIAVLWL